MRVRSIVLLSFILVLFSGCQKEDEPEEIEYVETGSVPHYNLILEKELEINAYKTGKDKVQFGDLADFIIDEKNNFLVLERQTSQVHKFSKDGEYIKSFGRKGRGPCECIHPGSLFLYSNRYLYLSQVPSKLISFDTDLNCFNEIKLSTSLFWVYTNQANLPTYFLIHQRMNGKVRGYIRSFHTFNPQWIIQDTIAAVEYKTNEETKGNIRIINYTVPKKYIVDDYGKLWLNESTDYKITLMNHGKKIRIIGVRVPMEKYTEKQIALYKSEFEIHRANSVIAQAGMKSVTGRLPEYHPAITRILNFHDQIWIVLRKTETDSVQAIHIYNLNGELAKVVYSESDYFKMGNALIKKKDSLYIMGDIENNYSIRKYRMVLTKINMPAKNTE